MKMVSPETVVTNALFEKWADQFVECSWFYSYDDRPFLKFPNSNGATVTIERQRFESHNEYAIIYREKGCATNWGAFRQKDDAFRFVAFKVAVLVFGWSIEWAGPAPIVRKSFLDG
jgi:hypothetical protein